MVAIGNVVKEFNIRNTRIKICDDYCKDKSQEEIDAILDRIAKLAIGPLTFAANNSDNENE